MEHWEFRRSKDFDALHKLKGTTPEPHEGYFRHNDGSFIVTDAEGDPVASVNFKGSAKRGQAWNAPDPIGMSRARLMAAAPELLEALEDLLEAIPKQTNDADWWPDELTQAVRVAKATVAEVREG